MPPISSPTFQFNERKQKEHWIRIAQFNGDLEAFLSFVADSSNSEHQRFGSYAMVQVKEFRPEVEREVGPFRGPGAFLIFLDQADNQFFVSLSKRSEAIRLKTGLEMLDDAHITQDHNASRDAVLDYLKIHDKEPTLGGVLILDAVTIHEPELNRISRTLQ
jgi:hypothetical protein